MTPLVLYKMKSLTKQVIGTNRWSFVYYKEEGGRMTLFDLVMVIIGVCILGGGTLLVSGFYFYNYSIKRSEKDFLNTEEEIIEIYTSVMQSKNWLEEQPHEDWSIHSDDQLTLHATYIPAKRATNRYVILVHGYMSQNQDMAGFAHLYHNKYQFNVIMPDLRGHGRSEGHYIGFGYQDRLDILKWIQFLINEKENCEIVLHGLSMGAATVNFLSGETLPEEVKFIVSDCSYDSIEGILRYQMKRLFHLPAFPLLNVTSLVTRLKAGYSFTKKDIKDYVKLSTKPMLFIHGGSDYFVPTKMVYTLYNACRTDKKLLIVKGAGHGAAHIKDPIHYEKALEEFIMTYISTV